MKKGRATEGFEKKDVGEGATGDRKMKRWGGGVMMTDAFATFQ